MDERATTPSSIEEEIKSYYSTPIEKIQFYKEKHLQTSDKYTPLSSQSIKLDFFHTETHKKNQKLLINEDAIHIEIEPENLFSNCQNSRKHTCGSLKIINRNQRLDEIIQGKTFVADENLASGKDFSKQSILNRLKNLKNQSEFGTKQIELAKRTTTETSGFMTPKKLFDNNAKEINGIYLQETAKKSGSCTSSIIANDADDSFRAPRAYSTSSNNEKTYIKRRCMRFENDYEIIEALGSGYFGRVYKCKNKFDNALYAVKCTEINLKKRRNGIEPVSEAQTLASLNALDDNPYVVRYFNAWIEEQFLFIVMELCHYSLREIINTSDKPFPESKIRELMRDVCGGLKYIHKRNLTHLDIKPENILFSKTKKYKVADLGITRKNISGEDIEEGDARYMAPELLNTSRSDKLGDLTKADIFSFGATIYEIMLGEPLPSRGPEWHNIRNEKSKLDELGSYSETLRNLVKSMMSMKPEKRPTAEELLDCDFLQSDIERQLKWEKILNERYKSLIKDYESKLRVHRKSSS